jgi:hypothetical protein
MYFEFDGVFLRASVRVGNLGGSFPNSRFNPLNHASARLGIFEGYDGIACFVDKTSVAALEHSKVELNLLLSDRTISQQPIVILVHTQNASGCANDPELISEWELEDVIKERKGHVSVFAYSLSPTQFIECSEGQLRR